MKYRFKPERNKDNLLNSYSDEQLLHAIGVPITNKRFISPFRNDKHPDCKLISSDNGRIYYADYALYGVRKLDVFSLVMELYSISFGEAVSYLWDITNGNVQGKSIVAKENVPVIKKTYPANIEVQPRDWLDFDLQWWMSYGVDLNTLERYNVRPLQSVWLDNNKMYSYFQGVNPAYAYYIQGSIKVYYPFNKKYRFLSNNARVLQGYEQLPDKGDYLVITKSMKDVMLLARYNVDAVAPQSETIICNDNIMDGLKDRFKLVVIFMDQDRAGKHALYQWRKKGYDVLLIPYKYGAKDISDFYRKFGPEKTRNLVSIAKKHYDI